MAYYLSDRRTKGQPDPAEKITVTLGDKTFTAGRRTAAHLEWTIAELARQHPDAHLHVMQSCYHTGYAPSAGTHDGDGCLDVYISGLSWEDGQRFLRRCGWACWWRHTGTWAAQSEWHFHMCSLGCPGPVGEFVPGQIDDYHRHSYGLKGQHNSGADPSWFPPDIDATYFDYPAYLAEKEANMPLTDADLQKVTDAVSAVIDKKLEDAVNELLARIPDEVMIPTAQDPKAQISVARSLTTLLSRTIPKKAS